MDFMKSTEIFNLKIRHSHLDFQLLSFLRSSHYTSIIIRKNDNGRMFKSRMKKPLTRSIKVITVKESKITHKRIPNLNSMDHTGHDTPDSKIHFLCDVNGSIGFIFCN